MLRKSAEETQNKHVGNEMKKKAEKYHYYNILSCYILVSLSSFFTHTHVRQLIQFFP